MFTKFMNFITLKKEETRDDLLHHAQDECKKLAASSLSHLDICDYKYTPKQAMEELGLEEDLVNQLVDDYVIQIIKAIVQFETYLTNLQDSQNNERQLDYTPFRDLAHKNLGVARNLRIQDAQILLYELMKKDDLNYLVECLEALKSCAIRLRPQCAYDTLKLIELKSSL